MIAVITGDIINSRVDKNNNWLTEFKEMLNNKQIVKYFKINGWDIYRGDSFQIEAGYAQILELCFLIKAVIKHHKALDVRMAVGLGNKTFNAKKVTQSNGTAYVNSGECFEKLSGYTLGIKSTDEIFDKDLNLMLRLASKTIDFWKPSTAKVIKTALENPNWKQYEIQEHLNMKSQSSISEALKRAAYDELMQLSKNYKDKATKLCQAH